MVKAFENLVGGGFRKSMYKAKMRCVALLIIMLSMVSCGQNRPEQNDTEQNTSEVTEEMTPNTITTTAVSNEETEPVDLLEDFSLENLKGENRSGSNQTGIIRPSVKYRRTQRLSGVCLGLAVKGMQRSRIAGRILRADIRESTGAISDCTPFSE